MSAKCKLIISGIPLRRGKIWGGGGYSSDEFLGNLNIYNLFILFKNKNNNLFLKEFVLKSLLE